MCVQMFLEHSQVFNENTPLQWVNATEHLYERIRPPLIPHAQNKIWNRLCAIFVQSPVCICSVSLSTQTSRDYQNEMTLFFHGPDASSSNKCSNHNSRHGSHTASAKRKEELRASFWSWRPVRAGVNSCQDYHSKVQNHMFFCIFLCVSKL